MTATMPRAKKLLIGGVAAIVIALMVNGLQAQSIGDLSNFNLTISGVQKLLPTWMSSMHNIVPATASCAGTNLSTATVLTAQSNIVTTCASGAGVKATTAYTEIVSRGANPVLVYPPTSGAQFESVGAGNPVSVPVGGSAEFFMSTSTQGYVR